LTNIKVGPFSNAGSLSGVSFKKEPMNLERTFIRVLRIGAVAVGGLAVGALSAGALAVGAMAIGRLVIGRSRIQRLEIEELVVGNLRVIDSFKPPSTGKEEQ